MVRYMVLVLVLVATMGLAIHPSLHLDADHHHFSCSICQFSLAIVQPFTSFNQLAYNPVLGLLLLGYCGFCTIWNTPANRVRPPPAMGILYQ